MASCPGVIIDDDPPAAGAGTSFEAWLDNPASGSTTWVIAGRSHSGKTTLVENLLSLDLENASPESPDAKKIEVYSHNVGNSELKIVEIPGLDSIANQNESAITNRLQSMTGGAADVLLYCISIDPSSRLDNITEGKTINLLTAIFKAQIWERAILVFTFADYAMDRHTRNPVKTQALENLMKEYAQKFEKLIEAADIGSVFTVLPLYRTRRPRLDSEPRFLREIPALPVGETLSAKLLPNVKWEEHLYSEMLTKCTFRAVPMLVKIGKNQIRSKGNSIKRRLMWFGLRVAGASFAYLIATSYFGSTTVMKILFGEIVGVIALFAIGTGSSTWASSAHSIAQVRFQVEKKQ
jgi:GTPase SAR1 family protein